MKSFTGFVVPCFQVHNSELCILWILCNFRNCDLKLSFRSFSYTEPAKAISWRISPSRSWWFVLAGYTKSQLDATIALFKRIGVATFVRMEAGVSSSFSPFLLWDVECWFDKWPTHFSEHFIGEFSPSCVLLFTFPGFDWQIESSDWLLLGFVFFSGKD